MMRWPFRGAASGAQLSLVCFLYGAMPAALEAQPSATTALGPAVEVIGTEFIRVVGARRLTDGRTLVSDLGEQVLLVVPRPGATPDTVGRRGRGPGEYGRTGAIAAIGLDSTVLEDTQYRRRYLIEGTRITGVAHEAARLAVDYLFVGAASDRSFAEVHVLTVSRTADGRPMPPLRRYAESLALLRFRPDGRVDTLTRLLGGHIGSTTVQKVHQGRPMTYEFQSPLAAEEQAWMFMDGWIAVLRRNPYRVDWITPEKRYLRGESIAVDTVRVDARQRVRAIRNIHFAQYGEDLVEGDFPPWPEHLPPFVNGAVIALSDGTVMVRRAPDARFDGTLHDVIGRDGRLRYRLLLARNQRVVGADVGSIFVVTTDEAGFEVLATHRLPEVARRDR